MLRLRGPADLARGLAARRVMPVALAVQVVIAVLLAACGGPATPTVGAPTPVPTGVIAIEAKDYAFTPSTITVPAGSATFSMKNVGTQDHELEVLQGDQVVGVVEAIAPGLTKDATVTLAAGDYTFVCKLNGHDQLGMKGTLTVTGG